MTVTPPVNVSVDGTAVGGLAPYHITIQYGDGSFRVLGTCKEPGLNAWQRTHGCPHEFRRLGSYRVVETVTDASGTILSTLVVNLTLANLPATPPPVPSNLVWSLAAVIPAMIPTFLFARRRREQLEARELIERLSGEPEAEFDWGGAGPR